MSHKNPKIFVLSLPGDNKPLCKCHDYPISRQMTQKDRVSGNIKPYYWGCTIKRREWATEYRKKLSTEKYRTIRNARLKKFGITEREYQDMLKQRIMRLSGDGWYEKHK